MRYVLPVPSPLRGQLLSYSRLYAYPTEPEPPPERGIVILDSGAFGLSLRGGQMDAAYRARLATHYRQHCTPGIVAIAPDVYLNPARSVQQWNDWHAQPDAPPVVPVIQARVPKRFDLFAVRHQCLAYGRQPMVAISNPGLRAAEARDIPRVVQMVRDLMRPTYVHLLGAGWDRDDLRGWAQVEGIDSMDSIAYYTAAQDGVAWAGQAGATWQETAQANARLAWRLLAGEREGCADSS